jgi:hypothetical protein
MPWRVAALAGQGMIETLDAGRLAALRRARELDAGCPLGLP